MTQTEIHFQFFYDFDLRITFGRRRFYEISTVHYHHTRGVLDVMLLAL